MLKRGGLRLLTTGEIALAQKIFASSIRYHQVWIHHGSYLPFNIQDNNTAMTPNGEIWFETKVYRDDYSTATVDSQHLFLHEMVHVWQHQRGMMVRTRGLFSWAVDYYYDLNGKKLSDYGMEQQAAIVSDYWLLLNHGFYKYTESIKYKYYSPVESDRNLSLKYKRVLGSFPL
ncbi:Uncharacterised protein [Cedecea neteri]|uniref:Type IV secretion protein Rhs n=1 Tax=Cedecea neteri TaxID=158822 RepID=A0A291DZY5_9ENTR|nr:hypothetical protein [Cedecea neteri]ATF93206.1 type IV secretion protein Rhs [Cedecea neteri]SQC94085.1 Uncharacterised protein [Cedecea neteri]